MRVLVLSQYFWPENFRINDVVKSLSRKIEGVSVLTGKPNYPQGKVFDGYRVWGTSEEVFEGVNVLRVPLIPRGRSGVRLALNYLSFIFSAMIFAPWALRKRKFDVIFVYAPSPILQALPAIFLGFLKRTPVVLWVQDLWPASLSATGHVKNKHVLKLVEGVVRYIYRHVDLLLVQSEAFVEPVEAIASGTPVVYFPNSVDDSFSGSPRSAAPNIAGMDAPFPILFAGNIGTAQAVDVIVEAAALLQDFPDIQFVMVGDGSRREWMVESARARGLENLHLPGRFPVETMPGLMKKSAALLVTLADEEIFRQTIPSKIQAYLAAGRPILACLNGEGARLVNVAGAGLAVPAGDAVALAKMALRLYRISAQERAVMGLSGAAYFARHFSHEMLIDRLVEILESCIKLRK